jgi:ribonuclease HI
MAAPSHPAADPGPSAAAPLTLGLDEPGPVASESPSLAGRPATGFLIRTDGAARGNPGPASAGAVLLRLERPDARDPAARPDASISEYLGIRTNNVAEYIGVVRAVGLARELGAERVEMLLDSNLIVEQLHGRWRVKDSKLKPLWAEVLRGLRELPRGWTAAHVPRAQNKLADALANAAIDRVAAGGPAVVVIRPA